MSKAQGVSLLALSSVLWAGGVAVAQSDEAVEEANFQDEDIIIVTGQAPIAESEAAAYKRQRESDQIINVVAADSIGRLPDQNVASALSRLPGVSVERDQGQERYVNLRGAPNKWTTISFNGLNVISPEGRQSRFDTIPNAIVSSIEAVKAVTADMPAESIAGNINIITRDAFDYNSLKVSGEIAGGFLELGDGPQYNIAGTVSNTFRDGTIGILLSGSFYKREQITDNIEGRFERAAEAQGTAGEDLIWSRQSDYRVYHLERANKGLTARLDWRPDDENRLFISSIFTEFTDDEIRDRYIFDFDSSTPGNCYAQVEAPCGNSPVSGTIIGAGINATYNTNQYRENIFTNSVGGDHLVNDWDISWRLGFTHTVDELIAPARYNYISPTDPSLRPSVVYDYANADFPTSFLFTTVQQPNGSFAVGDRLTALPLNYLSFNRIQSFNELDRTQAYLAKVDFSKELTLFNTPVEVKTGLSFDRRLKKGGRNETLITRSSLAAAGLTAPDVSALLTNNEWDGTFPIHFDITTFSSPRALEIHNDLLAQGAGITPAGVAEQNYFRVQEDIYAGYVSAIADHDWGNVTYGLRAEFSKNEGDAFAQVGSGPFRPVNEENDRLDIFPSVHVNYNLSEDKKLRFSLNSGLARPDFDEIAPNFFIEDDGATGRVVGGNPDAKPEKTIGVDVYYEHYLEPLGIFSVGGFYKNIQDPLINVSTTFGRDDFNEPGINRADYQFETVGNGEEGYYAGVEVAYAQKFDFLPDWGLPQWSEGFGVNANLTLIESEIELDDGRKVPLFGSSDLTYNTSGYWEYNDLSLRVNWQWRTRWLDAVGSEAAFDRYWAQLGRLSFGARYQVNDRYEWFFDANNLTDQVGRRVRGESGRVFEIEGFGPRYMTGIRFNY